VNDPATPASGQIFEELGYGLTGIASESRSGDANGPYIRVMAGGGENTVVLPDSIQEGGTTVDAVGLTPQPLLGAIPSIDSSLKTPYRPDVRCETQEAPDINAGAPVAPPRQESASNPITPQSATPELLDTVRDSNDLFEDAMKLAAKGRSKQSDDMKEGALEDVNVALAKAFDLEYLLPLLEEEVAQP
jgi:hypothetical protein